MITRRRLITITATALLAGCTVVPKSTGPAAPPAPPPIDANTLPTDVARHRVALLVPLTGPNAAAGQSIANAATMALLDTNAQNLRVTTYNTATGGAAAAQKALADKNTLILGPLLSDNIPGVVAAARRANVPLISFSNDETATANGVFIMGNIPGQSVDRVVKYARGRGMTSYGALVPLGEYGKRASSALLSSVRANGGQVAGMESYNRSTSSVTAAARKLHERGGYQAVLIAGGGKMSSRAATALNAPDAQDRPQILGSELWGGEKVVTSTPALQGAWFASVSDARFGRFSSSYQSRFGSTPFRIATLGYDAVLLALRVARDWQPGSKFPTAKLFDQGGFLGLDGAFRFQRNGVIQRALEVREVRSNGVRVVSPAPTRFDD
ncbi:MAG: penicillin-binding protein activator [Novosphingobium sp.]|nr:penicillin-binding protein activator [Novosphingobium sp.]